MKTYSINHPEKGLIEFADKKRYSWLAAIFFPLLPAAMVFVYLQTPNPWVLILPLFFSAILVPTLDLLMGTDRTNPPEELVEQIHGDRYY